MKYFVLTTRNFEEIANTEISNTLSNSQITEIGYRKVVFSYGGDALDILSLRSVEDAFIFVWKIEGIDHTRDSLEPLIEKIVQQKLEDYLPRIQKLRVNPLTQFLISSSSVWKRNYSYAEVKEALSKASGDHLPLTYEDEAHAEFDIRVFLEHDIAYIGIRLAPRPLHRRSYKVATTKATLRADVAYSMAYLAEIQHDDIVLDPMCGSWSILMEASFFEPREIFGGDINEEAVMTSRKNIQALDSNLNIRVSTWDATNLPLDNQSIDKIICNLPFGKQIEIMDIETFYISVLAEFKRIVRPEGKIILLTSYKNLDKFIPSDFMPEKTMETNLNGEVVFLKKYGIISNFSN